MRTVIFCFLAAFLIVASAHADRPPPTFKDQPPITAPPHDLSRPLEFHSGGDTLWLYVGQPESGLPYCGGENTGGPSAWDGEVFTFEGAYSHVPMDHEGRSWKSAPPEWACATTGDFPLSGRCFTTEDVRALPCPDGRFYWHVDTYQALAGHSWWCGALTGPCGNWDNAPGYGDDWNQWLTLDPDLDGIASGDTVLLNCWVRYDLECDYDYAYIRYSTDAGASWTTLAAFNGSSGNLIGSPCGDDYYGSSDLGQGNPPGGNVSWMAFPSAASPEDGYMTIADPAEFLIGFQFDSDVAWSDEDGRGDTDGALFIDHVLVTKLNADTLEFEDMDLDFEPGKWDLRNPPGIANYWAIHLDPDPPLEPDEGADLCVSNASWQWAAAPFLNNRWRIPPEANGFRYRLMTPVIARDWHPTIPQEDVSAVFQWDWYLCIKEAFCDYYSLMFRQYMDESGGWCSWEDADPYVYYYIGCDLALDRTLDTGWLTSPEADSVQFAWDLMDQGNTGDWCWTTTMPPPHRKTQMLVDNVSIGLYNTSETFFHARVIDMFQDTFDLETAAHNALCANADMPKILARQESLTVDIHDVDGLTGPGAWVRLYFTVAEYSGWDFNDMVLSNPDPYDPDRGGTYIGSIHPWEIDVPPYPNPTWIPGTEVWYYIEVKDNLGNLAYWPSTADPAAPPPNRPYHSNYREFSILPGSGEQYQEPNRILLVDDFGRTDYDYHPCMEESTLSQTEDLYESILYDLGYCYDKYDIQGASTGLSNEPWDILYYPDPANPDSIARVYDAVVWFTSRFDQYTVRDTMQCKLVDFVRKGGNLFICGNLIGVDMTSYGSYSDAAAETCEFYSGLLGAKMEAPGNSAPGVRNPHLYAKGSGLVGGSAFTTDDKFHFHLGCPISVRHDLMQLNDSPPMWADPTPYLIYEDGYSTEDTLVAIYNEYDGGGKVVHMCFDLAAMVDSAAVSCAKADYQGRHELMGDILGNLFTVVPLCGHT